MIEKMREFQVVILAGGSGSQLYPLTEDIPKALLPVANRYEELLFVVCLYLLFVVVCCFVVVLLLFVVVLFVFCLLFVC
jgi:choline kinase